MAKRKKSKFSLSSIKLSWLGPLFTGVAIGIFSQHIPQLRAYTEEILQPITHQASAEQYSQSNLVPGQPISSFQINRLGYALAYDARNHNPLWIYEHLTADSIKGAGDRAHSEFKEDERIPKHLRATLADYRGQGFDRGHMAPAANHRSSQQAMSDTFYLTNMCPQCPQFNRGYWCKLEKYIRDLTKDHANIYVVTGPLYLPQRESDGKRYIKYQVIGPNDVAIPTHFFKVISLADTHGIYETRAYVLPNQEISANTSLDSYRTTVQKVEKAAGILF